MYKTTECIFFMYYSYRREASEFKNANVANTEKKGRHTPK